LNNRLPNSKVKFKLQALANSNSALKLGDEIRRLEQSNLALTEQIFANLMHGKWHS
jgi:hypothetical protein